MGGTSPQAIRSLRCYNCDAMFAMGHIMRETAQGNISAIIVEERENYGSKVSTRANPLLLLNAIQAVATHKKLMLVELLTSR